MWRAKKGQTQSASDDSMCLQWELIVQGVMRNLSNLPFDIGNVQEFRTWRTAHQLHAGADASWPVGQGASCYFCAKRLWRSTCTLPSDLQHPFCLYVAGKNVLLPVSALSLENVEFMTRELVEKSGTDGLEICICNMKHLDMHTWGGRHVIGKPGLCTLLLNDTRISSDKACTAWCNGI